MKGAVLNEKRKRRIWVGIEGHLRIGLGQTGYAFRCSGFVSIGKC